MIARLRGTVLSIDGDEIVVDINGIGYEVTVTRTVDRREGAAVDVVTFTDARENDISLYGFRTVLEKQVFLLLRKVKGIGSRLALGIVSALGAEGVLGSIGREDADAIQRAPGVGRKTAERIIVELRQEVQRIAGGLSPAAPRGTDVRGTARDVLLALEKLGFPADRARSAVDAVGSSPPSDTGEFLRLALAQV